MIDRLLICLFWWEKIAWDVPLTRACDHNSQWIKTYSHQARRFVWI